MQWVCLYLTWCTILTVWALGIVNNTHYEKLNIRWGFRLLARTLYHKDLKHPTGFTFKGFAREQWSQAWSEYKEVWCSYQKHTHILLPSLSILLIIINHNPICTAYTHIHPYHYKPQSHMHSIHPHTPIPIVHL